MVRKYRTFASRGRSTSAKTFAAPLIYVGPHQAVRGTMSSPTPEAKNTQGTNGANGASRWRLALRALDHRNFRLFFMGQTISLIGTWMQQLAMIWLVYRLTGSAVWLGVIGFSSQIPTFLLSPVAGVLTDRWN